MRKQSICKSNSAILLAIGRSTAAMVRANTETTPEEIQMLCIACEEFGSDAVWQQ